MVGCGAVGSLFAAHLATLDEVEVWAYDVVEEHVAAINADGLRLTGRADVLATVNARTDAGEIPPCEFGIVATKSMFTAEAIEATAQVFVDGAVCSVQNGVGNEELIAEHVPRVIRGTTFPAGRVVAPGVVQMDTAGDTWIGPFEDRPASPAEIERLADAMTRGGMPTKALADARGAQWTKLIFNAASNPLGALTGLTHGRLCELPATRALISGLVARGGRGRRRSGSRSTPTPTRSSITPRRSPTTIARRCSRTRSRTGARRSTRSTAGSCASAPSTACRRRSTRRSSR